MTDAIRNDEPAATAPATAPEQDTASHEDAGSSDGRPVQYGVGPFSLREVILGGVWLLGFIISFFSISTVQFSSVWTAGLLWILTIGVPTVAVFLIALRRLSPEGIRRVGSLGIDQFASVAFTVSAVLWLHLIWETVGVVADGGPWLRSWVIWVEFFLMLGGVVLTVFAPIIPPFAEDFRERREVVAHRLARPVRPVTPRPRTPKPPRPAPAVGTQDQTPSPDAPNAADANPYDTNPHGVNPYAPASAGAHAAANAPLGPDQVAPPAEAGSAPEGRQGTDHDDEDATATQRLRDLFSSDSGDTTTPHEPAAAAATPAAADGEPDATATTVVQPEVRYQAFWALVPEERDVVDEYGTPLFRIGPTAWALVIEDRETLFVVRHEDGRTGYLHDVSGVTRG